MARFVGSSLKSENPGEDEVIKKLIKYFDNTCVIFRNRPVLGTQFDICLLFPERGIFVFEVKAWYPDTIQGVENGDAIIIKDSDGQLIPQNPTNQARTYCEKLKEKIREKLGVDVFIHPYVCFTNISKDEFQEKKLDPVCEEEETFLKEDLASKELFVKKFERGWQEHIGEARYKDPFSNDLMQQVCEMFGDYPEDKPDEKKTDSEGSDEDPEDKPDEKKTDSEENHEVPGDDPYSILSYIPHDDDLDQHLQKLTDVYSRGVKLYLLLDKDHPEDLDNIKERINSVLENKRLFYDDEKKSLKISLDCGERVQKKDDHNFDVFHCSAYLIHDVEMPCGYFEIPNGNIPEDLNDALALADEHSNFNLAQYKIEHCDIEKNVVVKAGAGTGKTFTMIYRIAYICYTQRDRLKDMTKSIVMLTFTDAAAKQMLEKIKIYFYNYYLLSKKTDYLVFIDQIENMQISTIHSYAKKLISQLGFELGYGDDISISSGRYRLRQIVAQEVDEYITEAVAEAGEKDADTYLKSIGMQVYEIVDMILNLITKMRDQSIDVASLTPDNFCPADLSDQNDELHDELQKLIACVVPKIAKEDDAENRQENQVQLGNLISVLWKCLQNEDNRQRLASFQTAGPQFMFIDEFQDTDNVQIDALKEIADIVQYRLFVVGDVKQCIYRFRGAEENAFDRMFPEDDHSKIVFTLNKNYRTDQSLLNIFHHSFEAMGKETKYGEPLLRYGKADELKGTKHINQSESPHDYYMGIEINGAQDRMDALFKEIEQVKERISKQNSNDSNDKKSKQKSKDSNDKKREIAILVRYNRQADGIKQEAKRRKAAGNFQGDILTNTSGDLYISEPALDMMKLVNALLHYDEPDYLYAFVSSYFIPGQVHRANIYNMRKNNEDITGALQEVISEKIASADLFGWKNWNDVIAVLREKPVLQVLRGLYQVFQPWINYAPDDVARQDSYRLNVDLLFEELIRATNLDSLSINALADNLFRCIITRRNVDSRDVDSQDVDSQDVDSQDVNNQDEVNQNHDQDNEVIIRCLTVHKAKGLEYDAVILPYCSEVMNQTKTGLLNLSVNNSGNNMKIGYQIREKDDRDRKETVFQNDFYDNAEEEAEIMREEARILYVAMTRAKQSFSWIYTKNKSSGGRPQKNRWQDFILEERENGH